MSRGKSAKRIPLVLGLVLIVAAAIGLSDFSFWKGPGMGEGDGSGKNGESGPDEKPEEPPVEPQPPPPECDFRIHHDTIYHGTAPITFDDFVAKARRCAEKGKVVNLTFERPYTEGFYYDIKDALEEAAVAWNPVWPKTE